MLLLVFSPETLHRYREYITKISSYNPNHKTLDAKNTQFTCPFHSLRALWGCTAEVCPAAVWPPLPSDSWQALGAAGGLCKKDGTVWAEIWLQEQKEKHWSDFSSFLHYQKSHRWKRAETGLVIPREKNKILSQFDHLGRGGNCSLQWYTEWLHRHITWIVGIKNGHFPPENWSSWALTFERRIKRGIPSSYSCYTSSVMWEEQRSCLASHKSRTHFRRSIIPGPIFIETVGRSEKNLKLINLVQPTLKKRLIITGQSTQFLILKIPYLQWGHWALCSVSQRCDGKRRNLFKQTGMKELQANTFYH